MHNNPEQISLAKAYEVRHWMHELRCTEGELYDAVHSVGKELAALRAFRATCPLSIYPASKGNHYGVL